MAPARPRLYFEDPVQSTTNLPLVGLGELPDPFRPTRPSLPETPARRADYGRSFCGSGVIPSLVDYRVECQAAEPIDVGRMVSFDSDGRVVPAKPGHPVFGVVTGYADRGRYIVALQGSVMC